MTMNITLPRSELKEAVQGLSKVINGRTTLPVLACVKFDAGKQVLAQATDLDQVVEYQFAGGEVNGEGGCIMPLATLKDMAKGAKDEQVEIEAESPLSISLVNHVGGHAVRQSVTGMDIDEWPSMITDIATRPASGFLETYRRLAPFSSSDETRYILNAVFVEVGKGENPVTMVATDGRRLAAWNNMALPLKKSLIVPTTKFLAWPKLPDSVEIGLREDKDIVWMGVKAGSFVYSVKTVEGTYPNYRQVIPAEEGQHVITFDDGDVKLLKQLLATFPGGEDIVLVGNEGRVTLYGRGAGDDQWTTLTLESTTYQGDRKFIGLNRHYLLDALAAGFREFSINDEFSPLLSRDDSGGTHVLMPLRITDPEATGEETEASEEASEPPESANAATENEGNAQTEPEGESAKPTRRRRKVTKQNEQKNEAPALDRVLAMADDAKVKVREAGKALTGLSQAIKALEREQKLKDKEIEAAKAAIKKVQSLKLAA